MKNEGMILSLLQKASHAAVQMSDRPDTPVAYVSKSFIPPKDGIYFELVHIPNNPSNTTWGDEEHNMGLFRIILHWPKNDDGPYKPIQLLASMVDYFTKDKKIGQLQIVNKPTFMSILANPSETLYPCSLRYNLFSV